MGLTGFALTLTVGTCPPSHKHWQRMVKALLKRFERRGLRFGHFVTEWQVRSRATGGPCPHLHCVLFFDDPDFVRWTDGFCSARDGEALIVHWLEVASDFGPLLVAQHAAPVSDIHGWFMYLGKHASRGVMHYQRSADVLPVGWLKTGRMWGKVGDWPVFHIEAHLSDAAFYALRRFATRFLCKEAERHLAVALERLASSANFQQRRANAGHVTAAKNRLKYLRQRLRRSDPKISALVPVSDWVPVDLVHTWLSGSCVCYEVDQPFTGELFDYYALPEEDVSPDLADEIFPIRRNDDYA